MRSHERFVKGSRGWSITFVIYERCTAWRSHSRRFVLQNLSYLQDGINENFPNFDRSYFERRTWSLDSEWKRLASELYTRDKKRVHKFRSTCCRCRSGLFCKTNHGSGFRVFCTFKNHSSAYGKRLSIRNFRTEHISKLFEYRDLRVCDRARR